MRDVVPVVRRHVQPKSYDIQHGEYNSREEMEALWRSTRKMFPKKVLYARQGMPDMVLPEDERLVTKHPLEFANELAENLQAATPSQDAMPPPA